VSLVARNRGGDTAWLTDLRRGGDAGWNSAERFAAEHAEAQHLAKAQFDLAFEMFTGLGVCIPADTQREVLAGLYEILGVALPAADRR
jgi:hypothetical protein